MWPSLPHHSLGGFLNLSPLFSFHFCFESKKIDSQTFGEIQCQHQHQPIGIHHRTEEDADGDDPSFISPEMQSKTLKQRLRQLRLDNEGLPPGPEWVLIIDVYRFEGFIAYRLHDCKYSSSLVESMIDPSGVDVTYCIALLTVWELLLLKCVFFK